MQEAEQRRTACGSDDTTAAAVLKAAQPMQPPSGICTAMLRVCRSSRYGIWTDSEGLTSQVRVGKARV